MMLPFSHRFGLLAITGALALGAASMVAGAGCTVLTNDAPPDDAGLYEGGDVQVASCPSCVASECTAASALCLTNEGCLAVRDCAKAGDAGCGCGTNEDGGTRARDLYRAFEACTAARSCTGTCAAECAAHCTAHAATSTLGTCVPVVEPDAGDVDAGDAEATDAGAAAPTAESCFTCANDECTSAKQACAVGTECAAYLACVLACDDAACASACNGLHATGKVAATELAACTESSCKIECGL